MTIIIIRYNKRKEKKDYIYMSGFNTLINIFICEDSIDGIFTAIYMAWEEGTSHTDISCIFDAKNSNYSFLKHILM